MPLDTSWLRQSLEALDAVERRRVMPEEARRCEARTGESELPCALPAIAAYDWPSADGVPISACEDHLAWAVKVADALGFKLRFERYQTPAPPGRRKITLP